MYLCVREGAQMSWVPVSWRDIPDRVKGISLYVSGWAMPVSVLQPWIEKETVGLHHVQLCIDADPEGMSEIVAQVCRVSVPVWFMGFSLGGMMVYEMATQLAMAAPTLLREVVLLGVRQAYDAAVCRVMQRQVMRDRGAVVTTFWQQAFMPYAVPFGGVPDFLDAGVLVRGLQYLAGYRWSLSPLSCRVICFHGDQDQIAPLGEAQALAEQLNWVFCVLPKQPHAALFSAHSQEWCPALK